MGVKYAEGVILNLEEMWQESTPRVPMVCFLSMGSDPTNSIDMLARKHDLSEFTSCSMNNLNHCFKHYYTAFGSVSMGQGQEVHARRLINQCHAQVHITHTLEVCHCIVGILMAVKSMCREAGPCCRTPTWAWIS